VAGEGAFRLVAPDHSGPLGTEPVTVPAVSYWTTNSNLGLWRPEGTDQCWGVLLCTPYPNYNLVLRGHTPADGFRIAR
jgi:hypothetical protein